MAAGLEVTAADLAASPAWLPIEILPGGAARLVRLDEAGYQAASFLDQRLLGPGSVAGSCRSGELQAAAARLAAHAHYVFHTGHVGSTLISRLIGAQRGFFALREPALLRALAAAPAGGAPDLRVALALLARTWRPDERAVIKATSFVSELAGQILGGDHQRAAIFMYAQPLAYLCGILGGANSRAETRQLAPARLARLTRRLEEGAQPADPRSEGEHIAMSWLCEMTTLAEAAAGLGARVLWVDFDGFLARPAAGLERVLRTLGAAPAAAELEALVAGPLMRQYSKAPEHPYDAALRQAVLRAAHSEHRAEIGRGMRWLETIAGRHPLARRVFEMSQDGSL
jgi:hypothetical protein